MVKALEGLSVVDISGSVSTEYCSKIFSDYGAEVINLEPCLLYTSPSPRDATLSRMPSSA